MSEEFRPVVETGTRKPLMDKPALDLVVALSCASLVVLVLAIVVWFVAGFAETDLVASQLFQASALALGVGALAVVPFGLVGWWAWAGRAKPLWTSLLMLPWIALAVQWIAVSDYDWMLAAVPLGVATLGIFRAIWRWREARSVNVG